MEMITKEEINKLSLYQCGICKAGSVFGFCTTCKTTLCRDCVENHKKKHVYKPTDISRDLLTVQIPCCSECLQRRSLLGSELFCVGCLQSLCKECCNEHACNNQTGRKGVTLDIPNCEPCKNMNVITTARNLCLNCREILCENCSKHHLSARASRSHDVKSLKFHQAVRKSTVFCETCKASKKEVIAHYSCFNCESKLFCTKCAMIHTTVEKTHHHEMTEYVATFTVSKEAQTESSEMKDKGTETFSLDGSLGDLRHIPGQPKASRIGGDFITLEWSAVESVGKTDIYQISYRESDRKGTWNLYSNETQFSTLTIYNLKSATGYQFRVRIVSESGDGPYSTVSEKITTQTKLLSSSTEIIRGTGSLPCIRAVAMKENVELRNHEAKLKRFEIDSSTNHTSTLETDKTILMLGTCGCDKGILIDDMINYTLGVKWNDGFRLTLFKNDGENMTPDWINIYSMCPDEGHRIQYRLDIIDVPAFDISSDFINVFLILKQIRSLLLDTRALRLNTLNAVCFVVKSTGVDITDAQHLMFQSVLSILGKDLADNIFLLLSDCDFNAIPALRSIVKTNYNIHQYFPFNSSDLFENNISQETTTQMPKAWDVSKQSFDSFFEQLSYSKPVVLEQTRTVLDQESIIETSFDEIKSFFEKIFKKANELYTVQNKLEQRLSYTHLSNCESVDSTGRNKSAECCKMLNQAEECKCTNCGKNDDYVSGIVGQKDTIQVLSIEIYGLCEKIKRPAKKFRACLEQIRECSLFPNYLRQVTNVTIQQSMDEHNENFTNKIHTMMEFRKYDEVISFIEQNIREIISVLNVVGSDLSKNNDASAILARLAAASKNKR